MMLEESCDAIKIISRGGIMWRRRSRTTGLCGIGTYSREREAQRREETRKDEKRRWRRKSDYETRNSEKIGNLERN